MRKKKTVTLHGKTIFKSDPKKLPKKTLNTIKRIVREGLLPSLVDNFDNKQPNKIENANLIPKVKKPILMQYPDHLNPFQSSLSKIRLDAYEMMKLNEFLEKVILAKNIDELSKIIDEALDSAIRINACNEDGVSFSNVTIFKMCRDEFRGNKQENIIRKLALNGADFDEQSDKEMIEICHKVQKEVEPQIHNRLKKLREIGESATTEGTVGNIEIDNKAFYMEFSQNSRVNVAKVVSGARDLGLSKGDLKLGGNIIKIGDGEIKVKTGKNGERNYADITDNSSFMVTFYTSIGELNIKVYHNTENYHQVQVRVEDGKMWNELQKIGEVVGQNCLFGGMTVKEAVEKGSFGRWNDMPSEVIKKNDLKMGETLNRIHSKPMER